MRGYIYNDPKLAYEDDGHWSFEDKKPHAYWCLIREMEDDMVLLAPVWFDLMDNLSNRVIETCPIQMNDGIFNITIGIGRCVHRLKSDLTTEPVVFLNPEKAKEAYKFFRRMIKRAIGEE